MYVLEYPLHADYAFIRAWKADTFGNLQFRLAQRNFNPIMGDGRDSYHCRSGNDIVPIGELDPDHIHVPGVYVDAHSAHTARRGSGLRAFALVRYGTSLRLLL